MAAELVAERSPTFEDSIAPRVLARGVSFEEFLEWDGENQHVEWVNGAIVTMVSVSAVHQQVRQFILYLLVTWVGHYELGEVYEDPFVMRIGPDLPGRAPDIFFLSNQNVGRLRTNHLEGPADLVVEVVSPGSTRTDREDKLLEYERGGVREYWLIDLPRREARFYERAADGFYRLAEVQNGIYRSKVLEGFYLRIEWLWREPLTSPVKLVKEYKLTL